MDFHHLIASLEENQSYLSNWLVTLAITGKKPGFPCLPQGMKTRDIPVFQAVSGGKANFMWMKDDFWAVTHISGATSTLSMVPQRWGRLSTSWASSSAAPPHEQCRLQSRTLFSSNKSKKTDTQSAQTDASSKYPKRELANSLGMIWGWRCPSLFHGGWRSLGTAICSGQSWKGESTALLQNTVWVLGMRAPGRIFWDSQRESGCGGNHWACGFLMPTVPCTAVLSWEELRGTKDSHQGFISNTESCWKPTKA